MRTRYMRDSDGTLKHEADHDWPAIATIFSERERVIYTADCQSLILQIRHQNYRRDGWRRWQFVFLKPSAQEMRRAMEKHHPFTDDAGKLDAICLKTDDGEYVDHSH